MHKKNVEESLDIELLNVSLKESKHINRMKSENKKMKANVLNEKQVFYIEFFIFHALNSFIFGIFFSSSSSSFSSILSI